MAQNRILTIAFGIFFLIFSVSPSLSFSQAYAAGFKRISVKLEELHCKKCGETIAKGFDESTPAKSVYVNVKERIVLFTFSAGAVPSEQQVRSTVESMGYKIVYLKSS